MPIDAIVALVLCYWLTLRMPGTSHGGALPAVTAVQSRLADELRADVETLASRIGGRSTFQPKGLALSALHIKQQLEAVGYSVNEHSYVSRGTTVPNLEARYENGAASSCSTRSTTRSTTSSPPQTPGLPPAQPSSSAIDSVASVQPVPGASSAGAKEARSPSATSQGEAPPWVSRTFAPIRFDQKETGPGSSSACAACGRPVGSLAR